MFFDNAMRLVPTITFLRNLDDRHNHQRPQTKLIFRLPKNIDYSAQRLDCIGPGSPTRKANKENTLQACVLGCKRDSFINHAAASRQEPYKPREADN